MGRDEELAFVRAAVAAGGCVVAGVAGVGKSRLAREAAGDGPAIHVLATQPAAAVPYGAFAHLFEPGALGPTDFIPSFIRMLADEYRGSAPVALVDDGHLLDQRSAALVLALATTGAARPLVTVRTPEPVPDAIAALWKERGLARLDLQSLGRLDVGDLVRAELGGEVDPRAVARIADLSLGNPLYVHELLHDARQTGSLQQGGGTWRWREELLAFDRLSGLIRRHMTLRTAVSMLSGVLALQRGHATAAVNCLNEAVDALVHADAVNNALFAAICRAKALAYLGDVGRAERQLDEIERLVAGQPRGAWRHAAFIETIRALVEGSGGRTSAAAARLLAIVDGGYGDPQGEIVALCEALRFGADPARVAQRLGALLAGAQDEVAEMFLEHAHALASDDAAAQMSVAQRFHGRGCDLLAAEAAARAAGAFARAGRTASSRHAAALADTYAAPCGPVFSWALQLRPDTPALTAREREIAVLAARGLRNKEIAEKLFLSTRTVEWHLLSACQKLGVDSRHDLPTVIDP